MKKNFISVFTYVLFFLVFSSNKMHAQFSLDAEIRPRAEVRSGFRQLRDSTSQVAALVTQRSRINLNYRSEKFIAKISFQDIRVWGDERLRQDISSTALHEAWVDLKLTDSLSLKLGRQELIYDNQRLLGNINWLQQAAAHDGAVIKFHYNNWVVDAGAAFNQTSDTILSDTYYSFTRNNYKTLSYIWVTKKIEKFNISGVFIADGYQKVKDTVNTRLTYGVSAGYSFSNLSIVGRGFLQGGKTIAGQNIQASYLNADISYKLNKIKPLIGFEYLSGNDNADKTNTKFRAFNTLYGTAHAFNGNMEYFTRPENTRNAGLIEIYFSCVYKLNNVIALRGDYHYFSLANKYTVPATTNTVDKYLGSEVDLSLKAVVSKEVTLDLGYSLMKAEKSLEIIQGRGDSNKLNHWVFLMLTVKPKFL